MINLIKNEIYKILHKRGTFIVLIITALFITLVSYLIGHEQVNYVSTERYYNSDTGSVAENKTNQEMNELSKKYRVKIEFECERIGLFVSDYTLRLNNITASTSIITDKHKYIQSNEFERDIKAFLYNRKKEDK